MGAISEKQTNAVASINLGLLNLIILRPQESVEPDDITRPVSDKTVLT